MPKDITNKQLDKVFNEIQKNVVSTQKLANVIEKREVVVKEGQAKVLKQGSTLNQWMTKESPLLGKTFKFFKEGKKRDKIRSIFTAKMIGPAVVKGLSLGLLKFGVGGAVGAAKMYDLVDSYQEFAKGAEGERKEQMNKAMDEMRSGENPKTMKEVEEILKKQGVEGRELRDVMDSYQETIDKRLQDIIASGLEEGKSRDAILKEINEKAAFDNKIGIERATTEKKSLELEKQTEQNEHLRHLERMDVEAGSKEETGGIFSNLLGSFKGIKGAFGKGVGLLSTLSTALVPVLAVAGTAFLAFKAGGVINEQINKLTGWFTGKEGDTLGGWLHDAISGEKKPEERKISEDKFFATKSGQRVLKIAKKHGMEITAKTTREDVEKFIRERNKAVVTAQKKPSLQKEVAKAEASKIKAEKEGKEKEGKVTFTQSDEAAIAKITAQIMRNMNMNVAVPASSKLDKIPSNSDDLQLAYMSKGGAS